ncbi:hypothetical protein F5J12DRAFT_895614 [Pisolithus orientalis]|uniref:uncharacterized protein n=1 Tax=Pisolithus orientalis TaxID=936130 RepID=UPI00222407E2|nr:uncharacterized protein F5J12DRAFT_895614 [Pisolithus orientalis]KAI5998418.1 hypothetical protein F5J12DRAFT_895614 [Pisolithus orientalis]
MATIDVAFNSNTVDDATEVSTESGMPPALAKIVEDLKQSNMALYVATLNITKNTDTNPETAIDDEMRTTDWLVQEHLKGALAHAAETHNISPLPVFDLNGKSINPLDSTCKLSSAVI